LRPRNPSVPLGHLRAFTAVDPLGARRCFTDFPRQPVRHRHWRGLPGDSMKTDLSRSIEIDRLQRPSPSPLTHERRIRESPSWALAHLVLDHVAQRLEQLQVQRLGQPADVVVALDRRRLLDEESGTQPARSGAGSATRQ
jgi:hypothetical protein